MCVCVCVCASVGVPTLQHGRGWGVGPSPSETFCQCCFSLATCKDAAYLACWTFPPSLSALLRGEGVVQHSTHCLFLSQGCFPGLLALHGCKGRTFSCAWCHNSLITGPDLGLCPAACLLGSCSSNHFPTSKSVPLCSYCPKELGCFLGKSARSAWAYSVVAVLAKKLLQRLRTQS